MTIAQIITGYIQVCGRFGVRLEVADGVLYVFNGNARLGYITQGGALAGSGLLIQNAYALLCQIRNDYHVKFDFQAPGEFIAYNNIQFGIVPLPQREPEPVVYERRPAADLCSVEYAL